MLPQAALGFVVYRGIMFLIPLHVISQGGSPARHRGGGGACRSPRNALLGVSMLGVPKRERKGVLMGGLVAEETLTDV